jgi:hypothetical protein
MSANERRDVAPDYDAILRGNAEQVFSERDAEARRRALRRFWVQDGVLYEDGHLVTGLDAISQAIGALLDSLPPGMTFAPTGRAVGHHDLARLRWRALDVDGQPLPVSGTDVALFREGKIDRLYVLLDPNE